MQRVGNLFEKVVSYDNLLIAFYKAKRGTKTKEAREFEFNLERELLKLKKELIDKTYIPRKYRYFIIKEPKQRIVSIANFRDRVIHHSIVSVLEPIFEKTFIYDSYANRKNKGLHRGIKRLQSMIKFNNEYYLKSDISKFFDNINYKIMIDVLKRKLKDKDLIELLTNIIINDKTKSKGLPIGNLTSQFFANIYLTGFDHFVKEKLKVKNYVRYMDDFVIIDSDVERIKFIKNEIKKYLKNNLNLELKDKATFINKVDNGISFCGTRIFKNLIRIKNENARYSMVKIKRNLKLYKNKQIDEEKFVQSLASIFSYWEHYDTYRFRIKVLKELKL